MKKIDLKVSSQTTSSISFFDKKKELLEKLKKITEKYTQIFVITDENVWQKQNDFFAGFLEEKVFILKPGEKQKNLTNVLKISAKMAEVKIDRQSLVIGIGGGVVTDLSGFTASIYQRGIDFLFIPTSLLAMVDAGIGGKTGVDTDWGKNQLGTFAFPQEVLICPEFLATLPRIELKNGLAEMLKHGIIAAEDHFNEVEKIISRDFNWKNISPFIANSVQIKAEIIQADFREKNEERVKLNLGHTFAHAIETDSNYQIPHGQAVAIGLKLAAKFGEKLKITSPEISAKISKVVEKLFPQQNDWEVQRLWKLMATDKKRNSENIKFIIPQKIGKVIIKEIPIADLK